MDAWQHKSCCDEHTCYCAGDDQMSDPICDCGRPGWACVCDHEVEIVGGEVVGDTCPECGSDERFYHCYPFCVMPTIVTCLDCHCPYKTRKKHKQNDLL